jgi:hypothetical protein
MTFSLLLLLAGQTAGPTLTLDKVGFTAVALGKTAKEPLVAAAQTTDRVTYRKDDAFAVWDSRGLSIRHGSFVMSSRLVEVAVTPKLFSREEILETQAAIATKDRKKEASALSGSRRIADEAYFLLRWDDKAGKPWLEALVRVNLSQAKPKPELVGKFEGRSMAKGAIDDKLVLIGTSPAAFTKNADGSWGLATFDRLKKEFAFKTLGQSLLDAVTLSPRLALAMEKTDYGKVRVTRMDLVTGARRDLAELSGEPAFLDAGLPPLVRVPTNLGPALRNLETGVQMNLPAKPVVRRTPAGIIVWPEGKPELGALYSPERFLRLATVGKVAAPAETGQSPVKRTPPP